MIVAGGGPAGLSAALLLGRCARSVLVCDAGTPRNAASHAMHGFISRDGVSPTAFRRIARQQLRRYPSVVFQRARVVRASGRDGAFRVQLESGEQLTARKLLLATGLFDRLPRIDQVERFFGTSVFNCPYCDGWEMRKRPLAVYARGRRAIEMARALTAWSRDVLVCSDGPSGLQAGEREALRRNSVRLDERRISRLGGHGARLRYVEFKDGERVPRAALFFDTASYQQCRLAAGLGCRFHRSGGVRCGRYEATDVPGVYVAGNTIKDVHLAIVAAAEGAKAAMGINKALTRDEFAKRAGARTA